MRYNLFDIPGFREAVKAENDARDAAFADPHTVIAGILIRQLTAKDWLYLDGVGCKVLDRAHTPSRDDISDFVRVMSVKHKPFRHFWKMVHMDYEKAKAQLAEYMTATFQDMPGGPKANGSPMASWLAYRVDFLAGEYGWAIDSILNMSLRVQNQIMNCVKMRHDKSYRVNGRSGAVIGERLRLKNERMKLIQLLKARDN